MPSVRVFQKGTRTEPRAYNIRGSNNDAELSMIIDDMPDEGGVITMSPGEFIFAAPLVVNKSVSLYGSGEYTTTIQLASGVNDYAIKVRYDEAGSAELRGVRMAGFEIDANRNNNVGSSGILCYRTVLCTFEHLYIHDFDTNGISMNGPVGSASFYNLVRRCDIGLSAGTGIDGTRSEWNKYIDNSVTYCDTVGISARTHDLVADCQIGNNGVSVQVIADKATLRNNHFEKAATFNVQLAGGSYNCLIHDNRFDWPSQGGQGNGYSSDLLMSGTGHLVHDNIFNSLYGKYAIEEFVGEDATGDNIYHNNSIIAYGTAYGYTYPISAPGSIAGAGPSFVYDNMGHVNRKKGATSVADGGTIAHGLYAAPTKVTVTPSTASEMVSVTALGATTFTVAIKKHDNSAGTTQTVYWEAEV